jgi:hypothetical protein
MLLTSSCGDSFLTWSFLVFPFLANYLWMTWLPLTKWCNNSFLSTSNHAMILSLIFFSLMCHQSHQSIFLYFIHQYLFPFEFLSISFLVMSSITQIKFSRLEKKLRKETTAVIVSDVRKRMKKGNNSRDWQRWVFLTWSSLVSPFLTNYLWMAHLPLGKWCNNSFLSSSNHAVILSLFFLSLMSHQSH